MEKDLHTGTHRASPEEILKEKILSARKKPVPSEEKEEDPHPGSSADAWSERNGPAEKREESYSEPSSNKTWFERNEYIVIGTIVLIVVIAGCIILNALGD